MLSTIIFCNLQNSIENSESTCHIVTIMVLTSAIFCFVLDLGSGASTLRLEQRAVRKDDIGGNGGSVSSCG